MIFVGFSGDFLSLGPFFFGAFWGLFYFFEAS